MAAHPNVTIEITVLENEAFKTKLTTVMQSGEPPDIFQSWGGGVMNEYAEAGLLKDITADLDADGGAWRNTLHPARWVSILRRQELRRAVGYGHGRFLVQQRPVCPGWH
jgi:raffinose/stachyose/melibiose transport system substrate-binding protein